MGSVLVRRVHIHVILIIVVVILIILLLAQSTHVRVSPSCLYAFPVFVEVKLEDLPIPFESQNLDGRKNVFAIDSFPLFVLTLFTRFTCDERNEF